MNKYEMLPCPLCGGSAKVQFTNYGRFARVYCVKCGLSMMEQEVEFQDAEPVVKLWNTRSKVEVGDE